MCVVDGLSTARALTNLPQYLATGAHPTRFADVEDVKDGFNEHREFLISQMLQKHEGINWEGSPIANYFLENFPVRTTSNNVPIHSCSTSRRTILHASS